MTSTNNTTTHSSASTAQKRQRAHTLTAGDQDTADGPSSSKRTRPDPYFTLPEPTTRYITLYFQLFRFKRVFRVVEVPLNYTFANLHTLIQFLFGWSGAHLHEMEVFDRVLLYKTRKGEIRNCGRAPKYQIEFYWEHPEYPHREVFLKGNEPIWRVSTRRAQTWGFDDEDVVGTRVARDREVTLGEVWNVDDEQNLSKTTGGVSSNEEIAIKYHYDFGASWEVHISCNDDNLFLERAEPSNLPYIRKANGAPPMEDVCETGPLESEPHKKLLPGVFYSKDVFARYCAHEMYSFAAENKLDIYTEAEASERRAEEQRKQKERAQAWNEENENSISDEEENGGSDEEEA
ncbi:hypothetical protein BV25DRAFT_1841424 [Artomyces pyxidatus]|uniref:Uncharacterized protein n=1 Tax=Artomyces pyxidatus TaxID=48021 RepID=A0ACB8SMP6_9AGAM|nr:hypothetical protein BV25DRAFT_1841424 [Artomyces pyxidatus]